MFIRDGYIRPFVLQALGVVLLIAFGIVWGLTGNQSALLVGASVTLILMGSASGAIISVRHELAESRDPEPPEPPRKRSPTRKAG